MSMVPYLLVAYFAVGVTMSGSTLVVHGLSMGVDVTPGKGVVIAIAVLLFWPLVVIAGAIAVHYSKKLPLEKKR